jgi:hypothetical protein
MSLMDGYKPDDGGSFTGIKRITLLSVEKVSATSGREGLKMVFFKDSPEHVMYKTLYENKMFNRFLTGYVIALGLNPVDLANACKEGKGDDWIMRYLPGRSGDFDCELGEPRQSDGKRFVTPFVQAEIDLANYKKEKEAERNGCASPSVPEPDAPPPPDDFQGF